jgi:hypothetical protein
MCVMHEKPVGMKRQKEELVDKTPQPRSPNQEETEKGKVHSKAINNIGVSVRVGG